MSQKLRGVRYTDRGFMRDKPVVMHGCRLILHASRIGMGWGRAMLGSDRKACWQILRGKPAEKSVLNRQGFLDRSRCAALERSR